jgi:hypothetical protein
LTYQGIADDIIAELNQKYNLRPTNKSFPTAPMKRILPRGEANEGTPKTAKK